MKFSFVEEINHSVSTSQTGALISKQRRSVLWCDRFLRELKVRNWCSLSAEVVFGYTYKEQVVLHPSFIILYNLYLHQLPFGACCVASFANLIKWALYVTMLMHFAEYYNRHSHSVDQIPSLEADRRSANQELSYFLQKQKIYKSSPPEPILTQTNAC